MLGLAPDSEEARRAIGEISRRGLARQARPDPIVSPLLFQVEEKVRRRRARVKALELKLAEMALDRDVRRMKARQETRRRIRAGLPVEPTVFTRFPTKLD
jgi:hypothetical protein